MVRPQQPRAAGNLEWRRFGSVAGQLFSEAAVEGDQFLVRMALSQKGRDGLLEEALIVRGTVIGGADAVDQRQGRLWPEAWVCGPAGDAQHPSCCALPPTPRPGPAPPAGAARARRHHAEACLSTPCSALRSPSERNDRAIQ